MAYAVGIREFLGKHWIMFWLKKKKSAKIDYLGARASYIKYLLKVRWELTEDIDNDRKPPYSHQIKFGKNVHFICNFGYIFFIQLCLKCYSKSQLD